MKKIAFLVMFLFVSFTILFAEQPKIKIFDIGNSGILKIEPSGGGLNLQIIYTKASEAPEVVKENLQIDNSVNKFGIKRSTFNIKFLDQDGQQVCVQPFLFKDFVLDENRNPPVITLSCTTYECGMYSYDKIELVDVDYN